MQLLPLVGFYWKHSADIETLVGKGSSGNSHVVLDLARAVAPTVKKIWPQLNNNNLLDDALTTLGEMLTPPADQGGNQSGAGGG